MPHSGVYTSFADLQENFLPKVVNLWPNLELVTEEFFVADNLVFIKGHQVINGEKGHFLHMIKVENEKIVLLDAFNDTDFFRRTMKS